MKRILRLRTVLCGAALAWVVAASTCFAALAANEPYADWFRYSRDLQSHWEFVADPQDPLQLSILPRATKQHGPKKKVLVLYPRASSAYDIAMSQVLSVFATKEQGAQFRIVNFELKDRLGEAAIRFAEKNKFDLILAMGSESTAWLYSRYRGGAIPVVSICSKDPVQLGQMNGYDEGSGNNFAFTSLNVPVEVQMAYIRELKPNLKNIAILVDGKNISAVQTQAEPIAAYARQRGIAAISVAVNQPGNAREELSRLVPEAVQTMRKTDQTLTDSLFWLTGSTSVFNEIRTINQYADRVPVVSVVPEIVAAGEDTAALSIGISFQSNGHLAAVYADQILRGASRPGELRVGIVSPPDISISFLKTRQIGMKVPFEFFETASFVYDYNGRPVRSIMSTPAE